MHSQAAAFERALAFTAPPSLAPHQPIWSLWPGPILRILPALLAYYGRQLERLGVRLFPLCQCNRRWLLLVFRRAAARGSGASAGAGMPAALRLPRRRLFSGAAGTAARPGLPRCGLPPRDRVFPGLSAGGCAGLPGPGRRVLPHERILEGLWRCGVCQRLLARFDRCRDRLCGYWLRDAPAGAVAGTDPTGCMRYAYIKGGHLTCNSR